MGILLGYLIFAVCWFIPPFLIFLSSRASGWNKAYWVIGCLLVAQLPTLILAAAAFATFLAGEHQVSLMAFMFGPGSHAIAVANTLSVFLPWIVYFIFRKRHAQKP